jgi:hypothetical protein
MREAVIMTTSDTSSFFGGSIEAVSFEALGDKVEGTITAKELRQRRDFDDPAVKLTWPDGRPKMEAILTIQTPYHTEDDDGLRQLYVRGYMQRAFVTAVRAAGLRDVGIGMWIGVTFSAEEPSSDPTRDPAKLFEVELKAPTRATRQRQTLRAAPPADEAPTPDGPSTDEPPF